MLLSVSQAIAILISAPYVNCVHVCCVVQSCLLYKLYLQVYFFHYYLLSSTNTVDLNCPAGGNVLFRIQGWANKHDYS